MSKPKQSLRTSTTLKLSLNKSSIVLTRNGSRLVYYDNYDRREVLSSTTLDSNSSYLGSNRTILP